ncbi:RNA-binding protein [Gracilaria domingensis]|nr:RNA-binding protein [Gracilaria domingensis]
MATSARAWSVAKLRELNFEGDAEALGQYIDAVIENNRDAENGDPELLRAQVTRDLHDFLADSAAATFVDALMRHLSPNAAAAAATAATAPTTARAAVAAAATTPSANIAQQSHARPSHVDEKLRQPLSESRRRSSPRRDRAEKSRVDNERPEPSQRRPDRQDRRPSRQTVMQRLGDRAEDLREQHKRQRPRDSKPSRDPREARQQPRASRDRERERDRQNVAARNMRPTSGDVWDRLGSRNVKRPRDESADVRDRRDSDERDAKHRRAPDGSRRRSDNFERQRPMDDRSRRDDRPARIPTPTFDQNGKAPPPWAHNLVAQMGLLPPPFPSMMPPPPNFLPNMGRGGAAGGGGGRGPGAFRGRESGRPLPQNGVSTPSNSKYKHFILIAVHIPDDRMMMGPIYAFFQQFGVLKDVQRFPPDKVFILFDRRESAQQALSSVEAVMGNRHIRLRWARESDFAEAGLRLTDDGTLIGDEQGKKHARDDEHKAPSTPPKLENRSTPPDHRARFDVEKEKKIREAAEEKERKMKEAEEDLRRKKEQIAELRRQQDERIAELTARKQQLLARQHEIFAKIPNANDEEKLRMKNELAAIQEETLRVQQELKPKPLVAPKSEAMKRFAPAATDSAASAFHDTERAENHGKNEWLLTFLSRRAAESAVRAQKVLKRCFGPEATALIVSPAMLETIKQSSAVNANTSIHPSPPDVKADVTMMDDSVKARSASAVAE